MKPKPLAAVCFAVLCITLTLGLWPFHAPQNDVAWLKGTNGLAFGKYGTVLSQVPLRATGAAGSIEIWAHPNHWSSSATLLTLYRPEKRLVLTLCQSLTDLEVNSQAGESKAHFYVDEAFGSALRQGTRVFITITYGPRGTVVYLNGALARAAPGFQIPAGVFEGRLIVGDSVGQSGSFRGELYGLAIYDRALNGGEAFEHYQSWKKNGRPDDAPDAGDVALYLLGEKSGNTIHNHAEGGGDLYIPGKYTVMNEVFLRPLWDEFDFSRSYWTGNLKNIVGFVPTGFCFYAYFSLARAARRALLATLMLGALVSLAIEVLQAFLPTRDSGMTDLITNTLGTYLGVLCYRVVFPRLLELVPRWR